MKAYYPKIYILFLVLSGIVGLCVCNIALTRAIYCSEVHMKTEEQNVINKTNGYNLDDMEKKLDSIEDGTDNIYIPKFRILFRLNPFDLRFETRNYKLCIN